MIQFCEACRWTGETAHTCPHCGGMDLGRANSIATVTTVPPVEPQPFPLPDSDVRAAMIASNGSIKNAAKALGVERVALRDYLAQTAVKPA